jgi:hypothetical protein
LGVELLFVLTGLAHAGTVTLVADATPPVGRTALAVGDWDNDGELDVAADTTADGFAAVMISMAASSGHPASVPLPELDGPVTLLTTTWGAAPDDYDDLVVGMPNADDTADPKLGRVFVLDDVRDQGNSTPPFTTLSIPGDAKPCSNLGAALATAELDGDPSRTEILVGQPADTQARLLWLSTTSALTGEIPRVTAETGDWTADIAGLGAAVAAIPHPNRVEDDVVTVRCGSWSDETRACGEPVAVVLDGSAGSGTHTVTSTTPLLTSGELDEFPSQLLTIPSLPGVAPGPLLLWAGPTALHLVTVADPAARTVVLTIPQSTRGVAVRCGDDVRLATVAGQHVYVLGPTPQDGIAAAEQVDPDGVIYQSPLTGDTPDHSVGVIVAADPDGDGNDEIYFTVPEEGRVYGAQPCADLDAADADTDTDTDADADADSDTDAGSDTGLGGGGAPFGWPCGECDPGTSTAGAVAMAVWSLTRRRRAARARPPTPDRR